MHKLPKKVHKSLSDGIEILQLFSFIQVTGMALFIAENILQHSKRQ